MNPSDPQAEMFAAIPALRKFARSLDSNPDDAKDLLQQTLVNAWGKLDSFEPGTNMAGWLSVILRNEFYNTRRKRRREVRDSEGVFAARLSVQPAQEARIEFDDFQIAFDKLPPIYRDALTQIGVSGWSYERAALASGCSVGTMKSRMHRGKVLLAKLMELEPGDMIGPDAQWEAAAVTAPAG
jgi:RNA polymerase sigma-70 factor, ECF subfamily